MKRNLSQLVRCNALWCHRGCAPFVSRDSRYFFCGSSNFSPFLNTA